MQPAAGRGPTVTLVRLDGSMHGSAHRGRSNDAARRRPCRTPARSTADRIGIAWHHSRSVARHSLIAACATSVAFASTLRGAAIVAGSSATVGVLLAIAAFVDSHERRLPNRLLAAALAVALGGAALSFATAVAIGALVGMAIAAALMLCVRLARGVGMGDVKMAAAVGASVGASTSTAFAAPTAIAIAAFTAATYGFVANRRRLPLGPSLWVGWAAALVVCGWLS